MLVLGMLIKHIQSTLKGVYFQNIIEESHIRHRGAHDACYTPAKSLSMNPHGSSRSEKAQSVLRSINGNGSKFRKRFFCTYYKKSASCRASIWFFVKPKRSG